MVGGHASPFAAAFEAWFAAAVDLHDIMAFETCEDRDAVEISFLIGGDALRGYAHAGGISVAAIKDSDCWDLLFDEDLVAAQGVEGWSCALCPQVDRPHFWSIGSLWTEHLFAALGAWTRCKLMTAEFLTFHQYGGATWAALHIDTFPEENLVSVMKL